jgi:predicted ATPase
MAKPLTFSAQVQQVSLTQQDLAFPRQFRIVLAGPSSSGKSRWIENALRFQDTVFGPQRFSRILYCSKGSTMALKSDYIRRLQKYCPEMEVISDMPNVFKLGIVDDPTESKLLILDDLMDDILKSSDFAAIMIGNDS